MAAKHGTRRRYIAGCRCEDCAEAERVYRRAYRQRKAAEGAAAGGVSAPVVTLRTNPDTQPSPGPGRVEAAVEREVEGLAQAEARPGLKETALALARIMDDPKALSQKPAASKSLAEILDKLRKGADARKSRLASVRQMTRSQAG